MTQVENDRHENELEVDHVTGRGTFIALTDPELSVKRQNKFFSSDFINIIRDRSRRSSRSRSRDRSRNRNRDRTPPRRRSRDNNRGRYNNKNRRPRSRDRR